MNPSHGTAWQATVHRVEKSWTWWKQLSMHATSWLYGQVCHLTCPTLLSTPYNENLVGGCFRGNKIMWLSPPAVSAMWKMLHRHLKKCFFIWLCRVLVAALGIFALQSSLWHGDSLAVIVQSLSHVWLWPHGLQQARLPCPSPSPRVCSNSCLSSWWCHPTISSSIVPFSFCLQPFPTSRSFPMSQLFVSGGQSIGASASTSVLPVNIQDWFPLGLTGLISLQSKGCSRVFSNTTVQKHQSSAFFTVQLSHPYMTTGKTIALTLQTFVGKVRSLLFNMLSRLVIAFLPRSKRLLILWL